MFVPTPAREAHLDDGDSYCEHLLYRERFGVENVFNHRDIRDERYRDGYVRGVARMNRVLDDGDRCLFVCLTPFWRHQEREFEELIFQLRARSAHAVLLYVCMHPHDEERQLPSFNCTHHTHFLRRYDMYPVSFARPTAFCSTLDELFVSALIHHFTFRLLAM